MIIRARWPGVCSDCNRPILEGDSIEWTPGVQGVQHEECTPAAKARAAAVAASKATSADIDVPAPPGRAYLPFQKAGVAYAMPRAGTLLADEMGLGKTIEALGVLNSDPSLRNILVIAPKSLTLNWKREARRWLVRKTPISTDPKTKTGMVILGFEQTIGSVEQVPNPKPWRKPITVAHPVQELDHPWDAIIVDEVHRCKNPKAQRTQAVSALAARARRRLTLTGSPVPNRPRELWPILAMTAPDYWVKRVGRKEFRRRYSGGYNSAELQARLRESCMVRRLKADVLSELPPKRRQVVELPASAELRGLVAAEMEAWRSREEAREALRVRVELAKASEDPTDYARAVADLRAAIRVAFEEMSRIRHSTALAKAPYVIEHVREALEEAPDRKIVIFAHHRDVIEQFARELSGDGAVFLHGGPAFNKPEVRQAAVDRFQSDPKCRVFVGSIKAAGVGYTLTAASHVVFAELDWVPAEVTQAEDRLHRIGQDADSVLVQHLVLEGSLDAHVANVMVSKMDVIDATLDRTHTPDGTPVSERPVIGLEDILPTKVEPATAGPRSELDKVAAKLTASRIALVHQALRLLAGVCDGARRLDGQGFNKIDTEVGRSLAESKHLTPRQAALGLKLVRRYRRQLGNLADLLLEGDRQAKLTEPVEPAPARPATRTHVTESRPGVTVTPIVTVGPELAPSRAPKVTPKAEPPAAPEPPAAAGTDHATGKAQEKPTMNPVSKSASYVIRILSTDGPARLVDTYNSWPAVNDALSKASGRVRGNDRKRVDYSVTHVESGATYIGRYDLTHPELRNWSKVNLAAHVRREAAILAEHYAGLGIAPLAARVPALRAWVARLSPAPRVKAA